MPLTPFQKEVLGVLVGNRSEASHFAGGLVLNAPEDSARYSHDFDVFHEAVEQLDMPIGVAFVDADGEPGWIRKNPSLQIHHPSLRGCWPTMHMVPSVPGAETSMADGFSAFDESVRSIL
jgi:hypothetical protein